MGTSNLDPLIISLPNIQYHQCASSSSSPSDTTNTANEEEQNTKSLTKALHIQIPSFPGEFEDDLKTPRSIDNRIPVMATCPPAPRKAKSVPVNRKRKASYFPVVQVPAGFIVYMDAMLALNEVVYVPDIVVGDLISKVDHAKKLKLLPAPADDR